MRIEQYLEEYKKIQKNLMDYLDYESNMEEKYQNLKNMIDDIKIHYNRYGIESLFYLIVKISNNHHRESNFFDKIEKILQLSKKDIKNYFSNSELFHIFKSNKRLLLFLFEEKIMTMDENIVKQIFNEEKYIKSKYPQYFMPEIKPYITEEWFLKYNRKYFKSMQNEWVEEMKKELPDNFYIKRKKGENDDSVCNIIQNDLIEEFIIYVNKNLYSINSTINISIYETNNFLIKNNKNTLIEYAAFFGSSQIFNYLRKNGAEIKPSLWIYAVHGNNEEIIHFLEENEILPSENIGKKVDISNDLSLDKILKESIKCHHIDIANYIQCNYLKNKNNTMICSIKYYNFISIKNSNDVESYCYYLCTYNYSFLVYFLLKNKVFNINNEIILILACFIQF